MDAFYASIEQRDDPRLRGRPVVVGGLGRRGVVSTASYEARRFGIRSAMPTAEARRRCPEAVFVRPRIEAYAEVSRQVMAVFDGFTPLVEPLSLDEAFLDVTGSRALFGDGVQIAGRLRREVRAATGLTVSVGVATTKFVAKVASDLEKPDGLTVVEAGTELDFLDPLPLARLFGAGPVTQQRLAALGLATVGEVRRAPPALLAQRLGAGAAAQLQALAAGIDPREVVPDRDAKSLGSECTFDEDLAEDEAVRRALLGLAEQVGRRLRRAGVRGRLLRVKVRFPPFRTLTRQATLPAATDDDMTIFETALGLCRQVRGSGVPVRLLGVTVAELSAKAAGRPRQPGLFDGAAAEPPGGPRRERLTAAIDAIRERFGDGAIRRGG
jgi:DNA polymerase-4